MTKDEAVCAVYETLWQTGLDMPTTLLAVLDVFRDMMVTSWVSAHIGDARSDHELKAECDADILEVVKMLLETPESAALFSAARRDLPSGPPSQKENTSGSLPS
jgi:hypothetical protein